MRTLHAHVFANMSISPLPSADVALAQRALDPASVQARRTGRLQRRAYNSQVCVPPYVTALEMSLLNLDMSLKKIYTIFEIDFRYNSLCNFYFI